MTSTDPRYPSLQPHHRVEIDPVDGRQLVVCPFTHEGTSEHVVTPWSKDEPAGGVACYLCEALVGDAAAPPAHTHGPHDATTVPPGSGE